jgi:hypothetical protein
MYILRDGDGYAVQCIASAGTLVFFFSVMKNLSGTGGKSLAAGLLELRLRRPPSVFKRYRGLFSLFHHPNQSWWIRREVWFHFALLSTNRHAALATSTETVTRHEGGWRGRNRCSGQRD